MGIENPVHLIFIGIVALLVLGPKRLPELARALGHGIREFRQAVNSDGEELHAPASEASASQTPIAQPALKPPAPAPAPLAPEHTSLAPEHTPQLHEPTIDSTAEEDLEDRPAPVDPA